LRSRPSLCRSFLFAPGSNQHLIKKVFNAGADAVVLDLEDSVLPDQKQHARQIVGATLNQARNEEGPRVFVRINPISTNLWRDDVHQVVMQALDGIRLAKAESAAEIEALDAEISKAEDQADIPNGSICVVPTIESAVGVQAAAEIARQPRVEALCFGAADFVSDVGADLDPTELQTLYAKSHLVLVSRAARIQPPIDSVYLSIKDLEGLRASSLAARRLGFFGRSCIHPTQIPILHEVFTPSAKQVAEAKAILEAFQKASSKSFGAFLMEDGRFVDQAITRRAREIIALAERFSSTIKPELS